MRGDLPRSPPKAPRRRRCSREGGGGILLCRVRRPPSPSGRRGRRCRSVVGVSRRRRSFPATEQCLWQHCHRGRKKLLLLLASALLLCRRPPSQVGGGGGGSVRRCCCAKRGGISRRRRRSVVGAPPARREEETEVGMKSSKRGRCRSSRDTDVGCWQAGCRCPFCKKGAFSHCQFGPLRSANPFTFEGRWRGTKWYRWGRRMKGKKMASILLPFLLTETAMKGPRPRTYR